MWRYWVVPALAALALLPAAALAHGGAEVAVRGDVRSGGGLTVSGEEFPAGEIVTVELRKDGGAPVVLGTVTVGDDEAFEATLHVPDSLRPGLYQLVATGDDESASAEVTVMGAADSVSAAVEPEAAAPSYDRPASETIALVALTAAVAALGGLLLWVVRTRPRGIGA